MRTLANGRTILVSKHMSNGCQELSQFLMRHSFDMLSLLHVRIYKCDSSLILEQPIDIILKLIS